MKAVTNGLEIISPVRTLLTNGSMNPLPITVKHLYTGFFFGKNAGDAYCIGTRQGIENKTPIIQFYGVNHGPEGTDEYYKGGNMIHTIRQIIHNDELFRKILRGLNQHFYHQTVTASDIQKYINKISGIDFTPVFDQYLRSTSIPVLEYRIEDKNLVYRWTNCNPGFQYACAGGY